MRPEQVFVFQARHGVPHQVLQWPRLTGFADALWGPRGYRLVGILRVRWKTAAEMATPPDTIRD